MNFIYFTDFRILFSFKKLSINICLYISTGKGYMYWSMSVSLFIWVCIKISLYICIENLKVKGICIWSEEKKNFFILVGLTLLFKYFYIVNLKCYE